MRSSGLTIITGTGDCQISALLRLPRGVAPNIFSKADTCLPRVPIVRLSGRYMRTSSRIVDLIEPVRNSTVIDICSRKYDAFSLTCGLLKRTLRWLFNTRFRSTMEERRLCAPSRAIFWSISAGISHLLASQGGNVRSWSQSITRAATSSSPSSTRFSMIHSSARSL